MSVASTIRVIQLLDRLRALAEQVERHELASADPTAGVDLSQLSVQLRDVAVEVLELNAQFSTSGKEVM